ncbi:MAG TPA: efflux RND transporter periplasmic adaptor subunit [Polyangiaceae bacterium]|nr:efflux RND transporter periplasmic adaptor subunit [Polyangiaceae bacterium]
MRQTSAVVAALVGLLFGAGGCNRGRSPVSEAKPPPPVAPADAAPVAAAEQLSFIAVISARHIANVSAQVEGTLRSVNVRLGESVREGDVIATIDDRLLRHMAAAARAVADTRSAQARASLGRAQHSASELERGLKLQSSGLVSQQVLETLQSDHESARTEVLQTQAASREALALLEQAERSLEFAVVRAPVTGTVALRFVDPGNQVHREEALVRIVADEAPWIRFGIPAQHRERLKVGDAITFVSLDGALKAPAQVVHIAPDVDPLSELVLAEGSLAATNQAALFPGSAGYVLAEGTER